VSQSLSRALTILGELGEGSKSLEELATRIIDMTGSKSRMMAPSTSRACGMWRSPSSSFWIAWEMTVLPFPGGPYTNIEWPALIAGPSWSMTRSLITRCENAWRTRSRVAVAGACFLYSSM